MCNSCRPSSLSDSLTNRRPCGFQDRPNNRSKFNVASASMPRGSASPSSWRAEDRWSASASCERYERVGEREEEPGAAEGDDEQEGAPEDQLRDAGNRPETRQAATATSYHALLRAGFRYDAPYTVNSTRLSSGSRK